MKCPKCACPMDLISFHGAPFLRCEGCHGLWFDGIGHKTMKSMDGSASIDIGTEAEGHKLDGMPDVGCPVCGVIMDTVRDTFHPHIRYETCPSGDGVFFDAGEFREFKEEKLGDFFKSLTWYFHKHKNKH